MLISTISPSNSAVFTEYILPNTRPFTTDPEVLPRITYARCISFLADTAARFLQMSEAMKTEGTFKLANLHEFDGSPYEVSRVVFTFDHFGSLAPRRLDMMQVYRNSSLRSKSTSIPSSATPPRTSSERYSVTSALSAPSSDVSRPTTLSSLTSLPTSIPATGCFASHGTRTRSTSRVV